MNVNINTRTSYDSYLLQFTHKMSQDVKTYSISTNGPAYTANERYCTFTLDLSLQDLNYAGEYDFNVYGVKTTTDLVYIGMAVVENATSEPIFTTYVSPNENNSNYIYVTT